MKVTGRRGKLSNETLTCYHAIYKMLWTCLSHDLGQSTEERSIGFVA
jgi:hypothetical protein